MENVTRVRDVRKALGDDMEILVDANQRWDVATNIRVANQLEDCALYWYEEPVLADNIMQCAEVASAIDIPVATGENEGFVKLIFGDEYGELLGAHIIGHEATEMIAEACAAMSSEATAESLAATMHAHPTMSEAFHEATLDALGRAIHL